eukprot:763720-Hanusia_phi.AAC.2
MRLSSSNNSTTLAAREHVIGSLTSSRPRDSHVPLDKTSAEAALVLCLRDHLRNAAKPGSTVRIMRERSMRMWQTTQSSSRKALFTASQREL